MWIFLLEDSTHCNFIESRKCVIYLLTETGGGREGRRKNGGKREWILFLYAQYLAGILR